MTYDVTGDAGEEVRPSRWVHLRHPDGFDEAAFAAFCAHVRIFMAYTEAVLAEWATVEPGQRRPRYHFGTPVHEVHRVTLPIGGDYTLASRAHFEDGSARLLSAFLPIERRLGMEEGLTETLDAALGPQTSWRAVLRPA